MNHDLRVNPRHAFVAPGKDILVLPQECRECLTDWWASEGANPGRLLKSEVIEEYLF